MRKKDIQSICYAGSDRDHRLHIIGGQPGKSAEEKRRMENWQKSWKKSMLCIRIWAFAASRMLSFMTILFLSVTRGYCVYAGYWKSGQPIKYCSHSCTRHASNPLYMAENILNRQFHAVASEEKRLTDATELRWQEGSETHKIYLRAILDLYDRRIVADKISGRNDNSLVFQTFDEAVAANPGAHPMFHSDRGFQYTGRTFHAGLEKAGMVQSMSRVGHCIDNGPMEGFWGILKRESYYGRRLPAEKIW